MSEITEVVATYEPVIRFIAGLLVIIRLAITVTRAIKNDSNKKNNDRIDGDNLGRH